MKYVFILFLLLLMPSFAAETCPEFPSNSATFKRFKLQQPPLLPMPQQCAWGKKAIRLNEVSIEIIAGKEADEERVSFIKNTLEDFLVKHEVKIVEKGEGYPIKLVIAAKSAPAAAVESWQKKESYLMTAASSGTLIQAESLNGLYYGVQTLTQLILRQNAITSLASCKISDWPDFEIRGLMNDVGRNFMTIEHIMEELDAMARLKYNVYHFHFTENYGWRLESKLYPELNKPENQPRFPGQNYSQEEFKQLVRACELRNIQLIPEMDMPGHTEAFRMALGLSNMENETATKALTELIAEMCALVPAEKMPYVHIGTDEVKSHERVSNATLKKYFDAVEKEGRQVIRWQHGLGTPKGSKAAIEQIWTGRLLKKSYPNKGAKYIDSHETYLNQLDPFEQAATFYFRRPCPFLSAKGMGAILCAWPDLPMTDSRNHTRQTPIFSSLAFASEGLWNSPHDVHRGDILKDPLFKYFSVLPNQGSKLLKDFAAYEDRVLAFRDRFVRESEFPYVRQANIPWNIIGPFPHDGDVSKVFPPEEILAGKLPQKSYTYQGKKYAWHPEQYTGNTIMFKHYCNYETPFNASGEYPHSNHTYYALQYIYSPKEQEVQFWIGAQTWATSDRRNGPSSTAGEWLYTKAQFYVNGVAIEAPEWKNPNGKSEAMIDENYHYREPSMVKLKKGWNQVLIKSPSLPGLRRWMFTFAPISWDGKEIGKKVREVQGLQFSADLKPTLKK